MKVRLLVLAAALVVGGCSGQASTSPDPDLRGRGAEAPVAVTIPGGSESLPTWDRDEGVATLTVPADLLFATDSAALGPAAMVVLGQVVDEARARRPAQVLVEGHADGDGDPDHNQTLSEQRAAAVAAWLTTNGLDPSTITTRGWGETRPVAEETDEVAKAENRRVVITLAARPEGPAPPSHAEDLTFVFLYD
ncbi:MAG: hypothetical protein QOE93_234 [Actinomycetota bacterium]|jgi:outer membrane protein OmpA-like peptidoglycan-associated protein|nr:hypothetical protein [Actinomycetota bacterium]